MYILVNKDDVIVGSATKLPSESACSKRGQKVYKIDDAEYDPAMINSKLTDFDIVDSVLTGRNNK